MRRLNVDFVAYIIAAFNLAGTSEAFQDHEEQN
jgi:hypothetical protein